MAHVAQGRFTAKMDEPFVVFVKGCGFRFTKTLRPSTGG
jgi:hypothetical protein